MTPAGGVFGASGVVDASGAVAPHVVIEPDVATPPAGETGGGEVPGVHAIQGQGCRRRHRHAPQDRRQQLDRRLISAIPARSSAYSCRAPLLGIACIVMAVVPALSYAGNRLKASFMFPKVGAHRLTPARPYY